MSDESYQAGAPAPRRPEPAYDGDPDHDPGEQRRKDEQHLRLLAILYWVLAGLHVVSLLISCLMVPLGAFMMAAGDPSGRNGPPPVVGGIFIGLGGCSVVFYAVYAYILYLVGKALRERRRRTFVFVMAIIVCVLNGLIGIALGIFTIVVLNRPSVKELFEQGEAAAGQESAA